MTYLVVIHKLRWHRGGRVHELPILTNESFKLSPECSATEMGQFPICKLKRDFFRTSVMVCTIHKKYILCPIWNLLCGDGNLKRIFSKKVLYNPLMGCSPFANYQIQMGVTRMRFAEHFGL